MMAGLLITSIGSGQLISRLGIYKPFPIAGTAIMTLGLALLSRLQVDTSTLVVGAYMLVLGLGLGLVLQVLVLAAQNAVEYRYLGVASSGSVLFRQIGGSIGVSVFGAIFANQLSDNLARRFPVGVEVPAAPNPEALRHLPPLAHTAYVTAVTEALQPVFVVAAAVTALAFLLTWLLPELPLRATTHAPDAAAGLQGARDSNALRELQRSLSLLAGREQRWSLYQDLAARAGVDLAPPELWLLARLGERTPLPRSRLADELRNDEHRIGEALQQLRFRGLADIRDDGQIVLTTPGQNDYERLVVAKCAGLRELLDGWEPDEYPELAELIERLGRDLMSEIPEPVREPVGSPT
jgi:hypothetical protein